MKVVHVIKRVEMIDNDVKELRKLEKSLSRDKSFSTPIYMTIEKQINILLGDRIKLLDLKIANPPESFISEMKDDAPEPVGDILPSISEPKKTVKKVNIITVDTLEIKYISLPHFAIIYLCKLFFLSL